MRARSRAARSVSSKPVFVADPADPADSALHDLRSVVLDRRHNSDHTQNMTTPDALVSPGRDERLTPWIIHDLPRIAWIVEYRTADLTDEERQVVRDAITRMRRALEHDAV
jgi:hypothetical protein